MLIDKAGEVFQFTVSSQHLHNRIYDRIYEYTIAYTNIRSNIEYAIECRINEKIVVGDVGRPDNPPSAIRHPKIDPWLLPHMPIFQRKFQSYYKHT